MLWRGLRKWKRCAQNGFKKQQLINHRQEMGRKGRISKTISSLKIQKLNNKLKCDGWDAVYLSLYLIKLNYHFIHLSYQRGTGLTMNNLCCSLLLIFGAFFSPVPIHEMYVQPSNQKIGDSFTFLNILIYGNVFYFNNKIYVSSTALVKFTLVIRVVGGVPPRRPARKICGFGTLLLFSRLVCVPESFNKYTWLQLSRLIWLRLVCIEWVSFWRKLAWIQKKICN